VKSQSDTLRRSKINAVMHCGRLVVVAHLEHLHD
jgi:hypothetical protein